MVQLFMVAVAALPLIFRLIAMVVPEPYLEPYAYWTSESLNLREGETQATSRWRNMGYWEDTDSFPDAAEALARRLIDFADAPKGGAVLDIAHGSGESLALHLSAYPPPAHLHGLTSQRSETDDARQLLDSWPHTNTSIELFTASASYRAGKDLDHPLNPMRGFLGQPGDASGYEDDDEQQQVLQPGPPPYDLVYILDAIYHFPPAVPYFLASVFKVLRPGTGVVAFTDILPPPNVSNPLARLILPWVLSVPTRNLSNRPKSLSEYTELLQRIGFVDVKIEDWSEQVWSGFAGNLRQRSWPWQQVAKVVEAAERSGWKFVAVRGRSGAA